MATTLNGKVKVVFDMVLSAGLDIGTGLHTIKKTYTDEYSNGTGANQANQLWSDTRTITASNAEDLDLAGALTNAFGETLTFTSIKGIFIQASSSNTNDVVVGGKVSNTFVNWVSDASDEIVIQPGGMFLITNPNATGYAVTAATGDILEITNSSSGTSVTYDIVIFGEV